jgi:hypothetical protein
MTAEPVPSDEELVELAWKRIDDLEDPVDAIRELADAVAALALEVADSRLSHAVIRVAREINAYAEVVQDTHNDLRDRLRPHRYRPHLMTFKLGNAEPRDDDNGDVDEPAPDA